jgi:thioesterase domain-containing protein
VRMLAAVRQACGVELSLGGFFQNPTVTAAADAVRKGGGILEASILPLNDSEAVGPPVYFVCGIHIYQALARHLANTSPCFGAFLPVEQAIFAQTASPRSSQPEWTVEQLAAHYADAIRAHRGNEPLCLAGVSFGGILAFEIARQLEASGQDVSLTLLLDAVLPSGVHRDPREWLKRQADQLRSGGVHGFLKRIGDKLDRGTTLRRRGRARLDVDEARLDQLRRGAYLDASRRYDRKVTRYCGPTLLIKAEDSVAGGSERLDPDYGWGRRLPGQFDIHTVAGDHLGILREPHVQCTAEIVRSALARISSR